MKKIMIIIIAIFVSLAFHDSAQAVVGTMKITPGERIPNNDPLWRECRGLVGACDTTIVIKHPSDPSNFYTGAYNGANNSGCFETVLKTTGLKYDENGNAIIVRYYKNISPIDCFYGFNEFYKKLLEYYNDKFNL